MEYLLVSGPDARGHQVIEWSGTDKAEALRQSVEHPEWVPWRIDPDADPSARRGFEEER